MNDGFDIFGYLKALQRRWWLVLICAILGSGAAVGVAVLLPPVYQSSAKILVESQQIPDELARSTVTSSAVERLELIKQRLMTRDNLLDVIERLNLFANQEDLTPTEKVDLIRRSAQIRNLALGGRRGQRTVSAFVISYSAEDPQMAARVANEFVTIVLEQNLATRSERATETHEFFKEEVTRLAAALLALETEMANYKNQNESSLPESLSFRHNELNSVEERIITNEQLLIELAQRRSELVSAKENGRPEQVAEREMTQEERDLAELRRQLLLNEAVYTETHPQMRNLRARIRALESVVIGAADEDESATDATATPTATRAVSRIDQEIALLDSRVTLVEGQLEIWRARKAALEGSITNTPRVEMALSAFERRYRDLQNQYSLAVRKQAEAATGEKLEVNRQSERFEIIEQARVSETPIAPARKKIAAAGIGGSLMLGIGLVVLLEMLFGAVHTSGDLERRLNMRPLGSIPYIPTREDRVRAWLRWSIALGVLVFGIAAALWIVDQYYLPLQLIVSNIGDKFDPASIWEIVKSRLL